MSTICAEPISATYLFDNDARNFKQSCEEASVTTVKTPEGKQLRGKFEKKRRNRTFLSLLKRCESKTEKIMGLFLLDRGDEDKQVFDFEAGIEKLEGMNEYLENLNGSDWCFVDFDKTITVTDGFYTFDAPKDLYSVCEKYQYTQKWRDYAEIVHKKRWDDIPRKDKRAKVEDLITVMMGGSERRSKVDLIMYEMYRKVGPRRLVVLTNNPAVSLVQEFMRVLMPERVFVVSRPRMDPDPGTKCAAIPRIVNELSSFF